MRRLTPHFLLSTVLMSGLVALLGTSCDDSGGSVSVGDGGVRKGDAGGASGSGGLSGGSSGMGGTAGAAGASATSQCPDANPKCSDGIDNDNDGKVDALDPECVGPCDNDEASFATGIPGDNVDACKQDCFFDGNSGQGDDGCEWNLKCDPANPGGHADNKCPYDPQAKCKTTQSDRCIKSCRSITPNGCDCFGCCKVTVGNATHSVILTATCTAADFGNPDKCPVCTQQTSCLNTCDKCEVCIGKPSPEADCAPAPKPDAGAPATGDASVPSGPPAPYCVAGLISCGAGGQVTATGCPAGTYCVTGCCVAPIE